MTTLENNLCLGLAAAAYARDKIKASGNAPHVPSVTLESIRKSRFLILSPEASLTGLFRVLNGSSDQSLFQIKIDVAHVKRSFVGNCGEYATLALNYLRKKGCNRAELFSVINGDHCFVVINRVINSDPARPETWGDKAVVCDGWAGADQVYKAVELPQKLRCYSYKNDQHILYPFNPTIHTLHLSLAIGGDDLRTKKMALEDAVSKLEIIRDVSLICIEERSAELDKLLQTLAKIIEELAQIADDELRVYSNLAFERKLSKIVCEHLKTALKLAGNTFRMKLCEKLVHEWIELQPDYKDKLLPSFIPKGVLNDYFWIILHFDDTVVLPIIEGLRASLLTKLITQCLDPDGTILHALLFRGRETIFLKLLSRLNFQTIKQAEELALSNKKLSLLQIAALNSPRCFSALLEKYDKDELNRALHVTMDSGHTLLHLAAQNGHLDIVKLLVEKDVSINLDAPLNTAETPIYIAANKGHHDIVQFLADNGAKLDVPRADGVTPIHLVANSGCVDMLNVLIKSGANINVRNQRGGTPVFGAAMNGHVEAVAMLLEHDASSINIASNSSATPLFAAAQHGHVKLVRYLLQHPDIQRIPFISTVQSLNEFANGYDVQIIEKMKELIEFKLNQGENPEKISVKPEEIAYIMGHEAIVEAFLPDYPTYSKTVGYRFFKTTLAENIGLQLATTLHKIELYACNDTVLPAIIAHI